MVEQNPLTTRVEIEEDVYAYTYRDSGAPPLWCYGSTCMVRIGEDLFVSGYETLEDVKPYNNVKWKLLRRGVDGWELLHRDPGRTREPCPLAGYPDGRLYLSINPTLTLPKASHGPARPQILRFDASAPSSPYGTLSPEWEGTPAFTEHSYRGLCADRVRQELLLMNILGHECYHWSLLDSSERWIANGRLVFPWGHEYERPQPIRVCYPEILLSNRAVHFLAVSDIVEPVQAWKEARYKVTGREWDYDFRRLFYTYTPDITAAPFVDWVEVASREQTSGHISNLDLWVSPDGDVHLLWAEQSCDPRIRQQFFPDIPFVASLEVGILREGSLVWRETLAQGGEGLSNALPMWGRFHVTPDNRLFVFYSIGYGDLDALRGLPAPQRTENWLVELFPGETHGEPVIVPLKQPLGRSFMTATPRAGSPLSNELELLGTGTDPNVLRYVRMRVG